LYIKGLKVLGNCSTGISFTDNKNGTVTDNLIKIVWRKNTNCFEMRDWQSAILAAKNLEKGDCGPDSDLILSGGSSAGDWRLLTIKELCTLFDFSGRDPALPNGHMFSDVPTGYHWPTTTLNHYPEIAWIVYSKFSAIDMKFKYIVTGKNQIEQDSIIVYWRAN